MMEWDDLINLSDFRSSVDNPRHRPDPYVLAKLSHDLKIFARAAEHASIDQDFIRRIWRAIIDGFQRLDALPRDNPFWERTNRRPTRYKLRDFCATLLKKNPVDDRALWTRAAAHVVGFGNFNPELWLPFVAVGGLDASWPTYAALYVDFTCGADSTQDLVSLLRGAGLCEVARPILERLAQSDDQFIRDWAIRVGEGFLLGVMPEA